MTNTAPSPASEFSKPNDPIRLAKVSSDTNQFRQFIGIGIAKLSTEKMLRETRGTDSMRTPRAVS
jgi:hypothetical protein